MKLPNYRNEALLRDFRQQWQVDNSRAVSVPLRFDDFEAQLKRLRKRVGAEVDEVLPCGMM